MLPTQYQEYIHLSRYARYLDEKGRRETWDETVRRYCDFFRDKYPDTFPYDRVYSGILSLDVMPSMRALMSAGPALERDNIAAFNCSYLPIDHLRSFDETLYILMCGTGVGFSVEDQYVKKLPSISDELRESSTCIIVEDSKVGWAAGFRQLISLLYAGVLPKWDLSRIRPAGSRLKVFGGRASGPEPLDSLFRFTSETFKKATGRKLHALECHDIICKVADCVVVGGVRRSALISLSNLTDDRMRHAKDGMWWERESQRALANNSAVYNGKPDVGTFMDEWRALYGSKSGERGIFNRDSAKAQVERSGRRSPDYDFGTNPCGEIILRPNGLCNLSEAIVRSTDSIDDLRRKVELAAIIGTYQSTLTKFRYLRRVWQSHAEEERLLGVSLTGIMDHMLLSGTEIAPRNLKDTLKELKEHAIETNKVWADKLGIAQSAAITTVKPSGTVSQLVDSASGIHPRHSPYYLRSVRADKKDPLALFMRSVSFPVEDDVTKPEYTDVFTFPIASPSGSVTRGQRTAIEQLEHYLTYKTWWCEHNPSITVYVKEDEWLAVQSWVYEHFNDIGGIAFLPWDGGTYRQAPYVDCTKEEYEAFLQRMPSNVSWEDFKEETDQTTASQDLACISGVCEI